MSVLINVVGSKPESDEYQCALKLKRLLETGLPKEAIGEIILHANASLVGQTVKDIDLLVMGILKNCLFNLSITDKDNKVSNQRILIDSFCTCIEIKSHDVNGIYREGTEVFVKYGERNHSVTAQSNEQNISTRNFFSRIFGGYSPFVSNLIWLNGVTQSELDDLLKIDLKTMPSNVLPCEFSIKHFMQMLAWQKNPVFYHGNYHFDSCFEGHSIKDLQNVFNMLGTAKRSMGELTRKRIEQITQKAISSSIQEYDNNSLVIYRGRAGTGKTVGLIQSAIKLVDESDARVLLLTYNKALVSDIRRLFALSDLPDMFQESCVHISTMHSFFYQIINKALYDGKLSGERFISDYSSLIKEFCDFSSDSEGKSLINEIISNDIHLSWDYCLVDEAQDWSAMEMEALLHIFPTEKIIVADGGRQYVREIEICDWNSIHSRKSIKLKYCLRQRNNIISFINQYLCSIGGDNQRILSNNKMAGGKIIVSFSGEKLVNIIKEELVSLQKSGNIPYDMIVFVPPSYVDKKQQRFLLRDLFNKNGITIWDGTNEIERDTYPLLGNDVRVLQYESGRGLEAWSVVCVDFDEFIQDKASHFDSTTTANSLLLESEEDLRLKHLINWALIPLTRAIDTVIITLKNPKSETAIILENIAKENPDYVIMKQEDQNVKNDYI